VVPLCDERDVIPFASRGHTPVSQRGRPTPTSGGVRMVTRHVVTRKHHAEQNGAPRLSKGSVKPSEISAKLFEFSGITAGFSA
jgi:hypothetical protein